MKKLLTVLLFTAISQIVFAGGSPVLNVELKGGIAGRLGAVISDLNDRNGASSLCFSYLQQMMTNLNYESVEINPVLHLDVTDYKVSNELLEYAKEEILKNNLEGELTKEITDAQTGVKRVYVLTWSSHNKFGDNGSIIISKMDEQPTCLLTIA